MAMTDSDELADAVVEDTWHCPGCRSTLVAGAPEDMLCPGRICHACGEAGTPPGACDRCSDPQNYETTDCTCCDRCLGGCTEYS